MIYTLDRCRQLVKAGKRVLISVDQAWTQQWVNPCSGPMQACIERQENRD
jgi:hypothetical protein